MSYLNGNSFVFCAVFNEKCSLGVPATEVFCSVKIQHLVDTEVVCDIDGKLRGSAMSGERDECSEEHKESHVVFISPQLYQ